ncbi:hypothetical protein GE061_016615 [Apolygus lucorum]|uniref:Uncharacterized protein n=1 Tax=Apolygus lucorum TaxID=248454 RepID=A0A8S9XHZ4_APOLU|nr:hypothetical protein GE061_016615 [Apolygus lucorum]
MLEPIDDDHCGGVKPLLMAKQHTILWNEEKYLSIAPGMNRPVVALPYDEHAEELSFPGIYLGQPRRFTRCTNDTFENDDNGEEDEAKRQQIYNTVYSMATSEIRGTDRRGVKPEHILYKAMKVMRLRLSDGMRQVFKSNADTNNLTVENIRDRKLMDSMVEQNFSFLKSIPNSVHYWSARKKLQLVIRHIIWLRQYRTYCMSWYNTTITSLPAQVCVAEVSDSSGVMMKHCFHSWRGY